MTIRILAVLGFATGCVLLAGDEPKQKVQVSKTERMGFPSGGTLRLKRSIGVLTLEAWDRPGVEITTIKSSDNVRVAAERRGDDLVITTHSSGHRANSRFHLEYRIKAPNTARIIADHIAGEVNIDGLVGDIQVTLGQGEIMLHLPEDGRYKIHATSHFGNVNSDFAGQEKRRWWLHSHRIIDENSKATHKLNLRVGFGDIVILKTRVQKPSRPLTEPPKNGRLMNKETISGAHMFAVKAVADSGIPIAEVTMTVPGAIEVISRLAREA